MCRNCLIDSYCLKKSIIELIDLSVSKNMKQNKIIIRKLRKSVKNNGG